MLWLALFAFSEQVLTATMLRNCLNSLKKLEQDRHVPINWDWIEDMHDVSRGATYRFGPIRGDVIADVDEEMFARCMEQHDILGAALEETEAS